MAEHPGHAPAAQACGGPFAHHAGATPAHEGEVGGGDGEAKFSFSCCTDAWAWPNHKGTWWTHLITNYQLATVYSLLISLSFATQVTQGGRPWGVL